jgi:soluble lytic murein transglycosylase-like protein
MTENMNVQPTGIANVRKCGLSARIVQALAGTGVASVLLVGSLFGAPGVQAASVSSSHAVKPVAANRSHVVALTHTQNVPLAYHASNETYQQIAYDAAINAGINPQYFYNQIQQESGFNPWAVSPAGAEGIAQFMPATAASLGVNPWDPTSALYGAANLMASLSNEFGGNYAMALAGYNAGPGAVQYAINKGGNNWYAYLPYETQNYIAIILGW